MKIPFFTQLASKSNPYDWMLYSIEEDFNHFFGCKADEATSEWRISDLNRDFSVCPTYPPRLIVPRNVDDSMLIKSSQFRANGRFPVLSYYHKKNKVIRIYNSKNLILKKILFCSWSRFFLDRVNRCSGHPIVDAKRTRLCSSHVCPYTRRV